MNAVILILGRIGATEILIIVLALVLLFGSAKIPELMRNLGKGINELKKNSRNDQPSPGKEKEEEKKE